MNFHFFFQVYHANAQYLRDGGGPVYIYLKDINEQGTKSIETGLMVDIARSTGALLLTFDMRFFGKNRPTRWTNHYRIILKMLC